MKISTAAIMAFSCYVSSVSVQADEQQQRQVCTSDTDCAVGATVEDGPGDYCSMVDQTCLAAGDCTGLADCTENLSNIFAVPMCIGTMYCREDAASSSQGRCVNICLGASSTCDALDACVEAGLLEGECCPTTDGTFLACCFADPDNNGTAEEDTVPVDNAADPGDNSPAEDDTLMNEMMMGVDDAVVPGTLPEADPTEGGGENPDSPVVADDAPADVDVDGGDSVPGTMPADPDDINAEEIGSNNCESKVACRECLADDTSTCGWVPAVEGCLESCTIIADASCYNIQSFNRDNNDNNNMMTGEDICVVAENVLADMNVCKSQTDCTSCVETNLVSETSSSLKTCQWFEDGNYCSSECGMNGCGETICSTESDDNGQDMIEMVGDDPIPSLCAADSDCNTSLDYSEYYCAAGTCLPQGGCFIDTDCVNPSNYGIKDTKCVGYLFCDTVVNMCDRKCTGFDCPGDVPATTCSVTGCDTRIACQGSVNCVVDNCDANCKGIFFDSSGTVLEECTGGKGFGDGDSDSDEPTPPLEQEKGGEGPPTPADVDVDASMPPSPTDVDMDAAPTAGADSTSTDVTTTGDDAPTTTPTADDDVGTPALAATIAFDASKAEAEAAASSSATVSILRRGNNSVSVSLLCTIVVGAMTGRLVVGII